jgi:sugar-specific transcriptional regulator TrmB
VDFIEDIATSTYERAREQGGSLPYTVIREIAENFIHAHFKECTVSILNKGNTILFSDQGPGIEKKRLVQQPGITSATADMKRFIRGVGSGFPIVKEYLEHRKGFLSIDDNAKDGTVITLSIQYDEPLVQQHIPLVGQAFEQQDLQELDERDSKVLRLFYEKGILGVSDLIKPLGVSAATAHRILSRLEQRGFIEPTAHRKRILSSVGHAYVEAKSQREQGGM